MCLAAAGALCGASVAEVEGEEAFLGPGGRLSWLQRPIRGRMPMLARAGVDLRLHSVDLMRMGPSSGSAPGLLGLRGLVNMGNT